jgi:alkylhydroperoxidase/carboxymuconolactone decarboxylase family protein YurZ
MDAETEKILESYRKERGVVPPYIESLAELKPEVLKEWVMLRKKIFEGGVIPRKYKELIVMAMCFARLYPGGVAHMKAAMEYGATKEEIFEVLILAIPGVGVPPLSTAVNALKTLEGK